MFFAFLLLSVGIFVIPDGVYCGSHHETTSYVDTLNRVVLSHQLQNGGMDPYTMPDFEIQSQSDHRVTVKAKLKNGHLYGLSRVRRYGTCSEPAYTLQGNTSFVCTIGMDSLNLTYTAKIKYGILPESHSIAIANLTRAFGVLEVTSNQRGTNPYLSRFTLATPGQFDSTISSGIMRREFVYLSPEFNRKVIDHVKHIISVPFTEFLARAVAMTPLPSGLVN